MMNIFTHVFFIALILSSSFSPVMAEGDSVNDAYLIHQAESLLSEGKPEQARRIAEAALQNTVDADELSDITVADSYDLLGRVHLALGDYESSSRFARMALSMKEDILGPDHADVAKSLGLLADIYERMNMHERADILHKRETEIRNRMCRTSLDAPRALAQVTLY